MAHISPAVHLVWALLSIMLGGFLLFHLWSFDRFRCLRWNHGPYAGAFKRVMTYSYLLGVPLLIIYTMGFAVIKYTYGFTVVEGQGIVPTPYEDWGPFAQRAVFPLFLSYAIAWGLEMVTHLEELCFWLFLVNSGPAHQDWFRSLYFKLWASGSVIAVVAMPLIATFTRENVYKCEAYTFLIGGLGSFSLTIWFLPVLWRFPSFLENLKQNGVERSTLVRLHKYHELNCIRVVFRFLFTVPLVILGVDGVQPHQHINDKMFATDLLGLLAAIGFIVSSGLTLIIFFPRSIEGEITLREERRARRKQRTHARRTKPHAIPSLGRLDGSQSYISITHPSKADLHSFAFDVQPGGNADSTASLSFVGGLPAYEAVALRGVDRLPSASGKVALEETDLGSLGGAGGGESMSPLQPNRRTRTGDVELGAVLSFGEVELIRARSMREPSEGVSGLLYHWRSPIEIGRPVVGLPLRDRST